MIFINTNIYAKDNKQEEKDCNKFFINSLFLSPTETYDNDCNIKDSKTKRKNKRKNCDKHGANKIFLGKDEYFDRNCNIVKMDK